MLPAYEVTLFQKDPEATLDYQWDWTEWLSGDSIVSSSVSSSDLVVGDVWDDGLVVTAMLGGGVVGVTAMAKCVVETAFGRVDERSLRIEIRHR